MRAVDIICSFEAVFTIAYSLLADFVTSSPRGLVDITLAAGLQGAGFVSGCNFVFFLVYLLHFHFR